MDYDIFGIVLVAVGIWLLYNTKKNKEDMSVTLRKKKKFEVLDKENLNRVMIIQNITYTVFCLFFGALIIIFNNSLLFIFIIIGNIVINLISDVQRKKYIITE